MIKKFWIYCKSDGLVNAVKFVWKSLMTPIYKDSVTVFYALHHMGEFNMQTNAVVREMTAGEVEQLDFPRLKASNYRDWLSNGSRVFVSFINDRPIGFTWTHYGMYEIHGTGRFAMSEKECWIGPTFVGRKWRGGGE